MTDSSLAYFENILLAAAAFAKIDETMTDDELKTVLAESDLSAKSTAFVSAEFLQDYFVDHYEVVMRRNVFVHP